MDFVVKPFELSPYNVGAFIIKNSRNSRYEMISEYQAELLATLENGGTPAGLIFPVNGVATSRHFEQCLGLLRILRKLELIERRGTGEDTVTTARFSREFFREFYALEFLQPAAEVIVEAFSVFLVKLRLSGIFALVLGGVVGAIAFLPASGAGAFLEGKLSYGGTLLAIYAGVSLSLSVREIFRAAFLRALQRTALNVRFGFFGPFLSLSVDARDVWMSGHSARMQMALLGLFSPMLVAFVGGTLHSAGLVSDAFALLASGAAFVATLIAAFPLLSGDGEEILHLAMFGRKLERRLALETCTAIVELGRPELMRRRVVWMLVATFAWSLLWLDFMRTALGLFVPVLARDLAAGSASGGPFFGAVAFTGIATLALLFPFLFTGALVISGVVRKLRRRKAGNAADASGEVSWEDKRRVIEKIPLFSLVTDETREMLLAEMENHTYEAGQALVQQGDQGTELFVLVRGEAQAIFRDATGKAHLVGTLREGDAFGEIALIDDVPRTASIVASTRCFALTLSKEDFQRHILSKVAEPDRIKQMIRLSSFFKRHPLLSRMSARSQAAIIEKLRFRTVVPNEHLTGGEVSDPKFFLIYTGKLAVIGEPEEEFLLGSEDCFGYLLPGQNPAFLPRVQAKEGSGLLSLSQADFRALIMDKVATEPEVLGC